MKRYAIYFAPVPHSAWAKLGACWLGRDAFAGTSVPQPLISAIGPDAFSGLTQTARHYGFHATLKAPFCLKENWTEKDLLEMARDFCKNEPPVPVHGLGVEYFQSFIAIRPRMPQPELDAFAFRCVRAFDKARAPLSQEEFEKQARKQLSSRQLELLQLWGYPHVDEQFQFHLTLSDDLSTLDKTSIARLHAAATQYFSSVLDSGPLLIDNISVFRQVDSSAEFKVIHSLPLGAPG